MYKHTEIGSRVKEVRKSLGLSQQAFAECIYDLDNSEGANYATSIGRVESGKQLPTTKMLNALGSSYLELPTGNVCNLGVSADYILFGRMNPLVEKLLFHLDSATRKQMGDYCTACSNVVEKNFPDSEANIDIPKGRERTDCGQRIRYIRKAHGLRQNDFGFDKSCTSRNECTDDLPNVRFLMAFCSNFSVPADYILFGTYPALPKEIASLLLEYTFQTQEAILFEFCELAKLFF